MQIKYFKNKDLFDITIVGNRRSENIPCPCRFKLLSSPARPGYGALSGSLPMRVRTFHLPNGLRCLKGQRRNDRLKAAGFCEAQRAIRAIQTEKKKRR